MHITITGASGFVGTNLSAYLKDENFTIIPLSLRGDWIADFNPKTNAIIHLAGKAHDTENTSEEKAYFEINRDITIALFQEFLKSEAKDFFYFSSVKAAADRVEGILDENVVPKPQTPYGQSKWEAEQYLIKQTLPEGKRVLIIRPCMIHGPGNKGNLNVLYQVVQKRVPWPLTKFDNQRSFVSIDNVSYVIHQLLIRKDVPSGIYHLADDAPMSTNQLIETMGDVLGFSVRFLPIPKKGIQWLARMGDVLHLPITSERLQKLTQNYVVSNQKIKQVLGIDQLPKSAEEGIRKTIESFRKKSANNMGR